MKTKNSTDLRKRWENNIIDYGNEDLKNATRYFAKSSLKEPDVSTSDLGNDKCEVSVTLPEDEIPEGTIVYVSGLDSDGNLISMAIKAADKENSLNLDVKNVTDIKVIVFGKNLNPVTKAKTINYK